MESRYYAQTTKNSAAFKDLLLNNDMPDFPEDSAVFRETPVRHAEKEQCLFFKTMKKFQKDEVTKYFPLADLDEKPEEKAYNASVRFNDPDISFIRKLHRIQQKEINRRRQKN